MTISVSSLNKEYQVPGGTLLAVDGVDLEIGEKEFLTLVGPSGCGKTTTLRCIAGLETPTGGRIEFNGRDMTDIPANRRNIAMMFQDIALYPHMTVRANIAYPLKVRDVEKEQRHGRAAEAAELLQISDLLDKYPGELSGGQQQRAALARTIVQDPVAFLMDEPLSDLDANLKVDIRKEIQRVHQRVEQPTIYVTHDQEEAMTMSDRIAVMNDGQVEQIGTPNELYFEPVNRFVATFIGNPNMNFVPGTITETDGNTARIEMGNYNTEIDLASTEGSLAEQEITIGFRPGEVRIGDRVDETHFETEVLLVEQIGDQLMVTMEGPFGDEIRAITSADNRLDVGQRVPISVNLERLHLFDPDTDETIASTG